MIIVITAIIGLNTAVFLAWRIPALKPMLSRYFVHTPSKGMLSISLSTANECYSLCHLRPACVHAAERVQPPDAATLCFQHDRV